MSICSEHLFTTTLCATFSLHKFSEQEISIKKSSRSSPLYGTENMVPCHQKKLKPVQHDENRLPIYCETTNVCYLIELLSRLPVVFVNEDKLIRRSLSAIKDISCGANR
jgi:hypothetical protein